MHFCVDGYFYCWFQDLLLSSVSLHSSIFAVLKPWHLSYLTLSVSKFKHKISSPSRDGHVLVAGHVVFSSASLLSFSFAFPFLSIVQSKGEN